MSKGSGPGRLTHAQFFSICEELRSQREKIEATCSLHSQVATLLEPKLGFRLPKVSLSEAIAIAGIKLKKKEKCRYSEDSRIRTATVLAKALVAIYNKLGEPVPSDLEELADRLQRGIGLSTGKPIGNVPPSSSIPVVKLKS